MPVQFDANWALQEFVLLNPGLDDRLQEVKDWFRKSRQGRK
jgi:hypothetical protein